MTQAFNLSQLANNLNTSGQLDATDGLVGAVPVANGGTGSTSITANAVVVGNGTSAVTTISPSTSGNVLLSNGTTWSSSSLGTAVANLSSFTALLSSSGYQKLPSGLILQWGSATGSNPTISFPISFPNAFFQAFVTTNSSSSANVESLYYNGTTSGMTIRQLGGLPTSWLAIGY